MMLDPVAAGSPFFDRAIIDRWVGANIEAKAVKAGLHVWHEYNPSHAYALGADTGKGNGGDHSTSIIIDFTSRPARQVASYANNEIPADLFAHELKRQADLYGTCLIAPEKNAESGGSCLTTLKMIYSVDQIYRQVPLEKAHDRPNASFELGWETNHANKYTILDDLRAAVEDGLLVINDERILREMRSFTHSDADEFGRSRISKRLLLRSSPYTEAMGQIARLFIQGAKDHIPPRSLSSGSVPMARIGMQSSTRPTSTSGATSTSRSPRPPSRCATRN
jgi:hypothetical protein